MYPGWSGGLGGGYGCGTLGGGGDGGVCGGVGGDGGGRDGGGGNDGGEGGGTMGGVGDEGGEGGGGGAKGGLRSGRSGSRPMSQSATPAGTPMSTTSAMHARQHMPIGVLDNSSSVCNWSSSTAPDSFCSRPSTKTSIWASSAPLPRVQVAGGNKTRPLRRNRGLGWLAAAGAVHTLSNVSTCCAGAPKRVYGDMYFCTLANAGKRRHHAAPRPPRSTFTHAL